MNPFLRQPSADVRTPIRAEAPTPKSDDSGVVRLRLYDPIDSWGGFWGISAKEFVTVLDALPEDTKEIRLLINSPGGEVWEGLALLNALRAHPAKVVAVVEGIAASSASFIATGVDECHVMRNAELFVHKAWGLAIGNASVMAKMSADLLHEDRNIADIYAAKAGGTVDEWLAVMADEPWYSADEAVAAGLADKVIEPTKGDDKAAQAKAKFDLSVFNGATRRPARDDGGTLPSGLTVVTNTTGKDISIPAPTTWTYATGTNNVATTIPPIVIAATTPAETSGAEPDEHNTELEGADPVSTLSADVRSRLGLTDDADDTAVLAAFDALKAKAEAGPQPDPERDAAIKAATAAKAENAELRKEVDLLNTRMEQVTGELASAKAERAAATKKAVLDEAQSLGKFKADERPQWDADYDEAPAAVTRMLARIAAESAVPMAPIGQTGGDETGADVEADKLYAAVFGAGPQKTEV